LKVNDGGEAGGGGQQQQQTVIPGGAEKGNASIVAQIDADLQLFK
jgi:hypothetical protein